MCSRKVFTEVSANMFVMVSRAIIRKGLRKGLVQVFVKVFAEICVNMIQRAPPDPTVGYPTITYVYHITNVYMRRSVWKL